MVIFFEIKKVIMRGRRGYLSGKRGNLNERQGYLKGALIISVGGLISKILGAVYRIPLLAFLGGRGMGIYQMVYPLYCILLTVSASGIPSGIARVISSGRYSGGEKKAFYLFGIIGLIGSVVMFLLSSPLAVAQGEKQVAVCCQLLSPSVFFVSVLSVVRGYFQGKGNMYPTAITEVMEQAIKVSVGIFLAYINKGDQLKAVGAAIFAVTISEALSTIFALFLYFGRVKARKPLYTGREISVKDILNYTLPLTFTALSQPLSQLVESIIIVNILRGVTQEATALYGIFSGCAVTLINLPVSLTYGLAASSVPRISPLCERGEYFSAFKEIKNALFLTFVISLPFVAVLYIFAPLATKIIFRSLNAEQGELLVTLVKIMSVNAITLSLMQTSSAILTSLGKPLYGTISGWASAIARIILSTVLTKYTALSICGAAISSNCAYLVAVLLNFWYIISIKRRKIAKRGSDKDNENNSGRTGNAGRILDSGGKTGT
jgi:stage V sporulation protein B